MDSIQGIDRNRNPVPLKRSDGSCVTSDTKKAEMLNRHFAKVSKKEAPPDVDHKRNRRILEKVAKRNVARPYNDRFSREELEAALAKTKSARAPGPDGIHVEMLKRLGRRGKRWLLEIVNQSWESGQLPKEWKTALLIPVPKKGKDLSNPGSHRPISLISCVSKLAERMVNARLYDHLENEGKFSPEQLGFRRGARATDQVLRLLQDTSDGLRKREHTVAIFVDLRQAYDRVWRSGLLTKLLRMGVGGKLYFWVRDFLSNRMIRTRLNDSFSKGLHVEEGLPQGSSLSCTLFLAFINDAPKYLRSEVAMYCDDMALWNTSKSVEECRAKLQYSLDGLARFFSQNSIVLNTDKTVYTVFTKSPKVKRAEVRLWYNGIELAKEETPSYLGITLDSQLTMKPHTEILAGECVKRLWLIRKLASTSWGANFHTLRTLYLGSIRSMVDYSLPVLASIAPTNLEILQRVQNRGLRFICGVMRTTPTNSVEVLTGVEPIPLRKDAAVLLTHERFRRCPAGDKRREMVEKWKDPGKMKHRCFMREARRLQSEALPESEPAGLMSGKRVTTLDLPPSPEIRLDLIDDRAHKGLNPLVLRSMGLETIQTYTEKAIKAYTDGSRDGNRAGWGVVIDYPDGKRERHNGACERYRSNYDAECSAIVEALGKAGDWVRSSGGSHDLVVFSDARSVLERLMDWHGALNDKETLGEVARALVRLMQTTKGSVTLQWIPAHCGIRENEIADSLAKGGLIQSPPGESGKSKLSWTGVQSILRAHTKRTWRILGESDPAGRSLHKHMPTPRKDDAWRRLDRRDLGLVAGFRTGHAPTHAHLALIRPDKTPECRWCGQGSETSSHLLLECCGLREARRIWLPSSPTIENCLYGKGRQLANTARFIRIALKGTVRPW